MVPGNCTPLRRQTREEVQVGPDKLEVVASFCYLGPGRVAQSVGHLTHKSGVLGSIPGLATYFCFSFRFFKKGRLAKVCARSTG